MGVAALVSVTSAGLRGGNVETPPAPRRTERSTVHDSQRRVVAVHLAGGYMCICLESGSETMREKQDPSLHEYVASHAVVISIVSPRLNLGASRSTS